MILCTEVGSQTPIKHGVGVWEAAGWTECLSWVGQAGTVVCAQGSLNDTTLE